MKKKNRQASNSTYSYKNNNKIRQITPNKILRFNFFYLFAFIQTQNFKFSNKDEPKFFKTNLRHYKMICVIENIKIMLIFFRLFCNFRYYTHHCLVLLQGHRKILICSGTTSQNFPTFCYHLNVRRILKESTLQAS